MKPCPSRWLSSRNVWSGIGNYSCLMAHFHQRGRIRTHIWIPVLCRFFHWLGFGLWSLDLNIWNRHRDLSLGWRSVPKMGTVTIRETIRTGIWIWIQTSGNKLCIIKCNDRDWNPSPSPSLLVEMSHYHSDCSTCLSVKIKVYKMCHEIHDISNLLNTICDICYFLNIVLDIILLLKTISLTI